MVSVLFLRLNQFLHFMRWLVVLSKVAFICNLFFLLCLSILFTHNFISNRALQAFIIILGFVLSFVVNTIVNITEIILAAKRRPSPVALWLRAFNFIIFSLQIAHYFIFGNAQYL